MRELEELVALRHDHGALSIHPYFGRMDPALATFLIGEFSSPGDRILDPFCGSGTVLHEGMLLGRNVTGWDSSPLAVLISAAKLAGMSATVSDELDDIEARVERGVSDQPGFEASDWIPTMPRVRSISKWFGDNALLELAFLRSLVLSGDRGGHAQLLVEVAFSACITSISRQAGESRYAAVEKSDEPGRAFKLFKKALARVRRGAAAFTELLGEQSETELINDGYGIRSGIQSATVVQRDSRLGDPASPQLHDLIVTSPPYLMSWDYGLYHKFRVYWLGFDLDEYEDSEVGRHLRRQNDDVQRYSDDMAAAFEQLASSTRTGATVAMVNAPSAVHGVSVDTNRILVQSAEAAGFNLKWQGTSLAIPGPHHGMYASLASRKATTAGESGKREHVLLFDRL